MTHLKIYYILLIMNKYQEGKIYKLVGNNLIYIGSTIRTLYHRLREHEYRSKGILKHCSSSSKLLYENNNNVIIELIELYPCNNRRELEEREAYWINSLNCINIKKPFVSKEEQKNKKRDYGRSSKIKEYKKEYQNNHREEKKSYDKIYKEKNKEYLSQKIKCECGGSYTLQHKTTHFKTKKHMEYYAKD